VVKHTFAPGRRNTRPLPRSWPYHHSSAPAFTAARPGTVLSRALIPHVEADQILEAPAQDPQVVYAEGRYHYCESTAQGIFIRSAIRLDLLARSTPVRIWAPSRRGPCSKNIWAPELHFLDGRWYVYFAADDGRNENHRMWVLASDDSNVRGRYSLQGCLDTQGWAIDGTVFRSGRQLYFVWSGWPGSTDGQQNLYVSRMASPIELCGGRTLIASPNQAWERNAMPICEGPQVLQRGDRTFIVYSASASWTADYCLGMLVHDGNGDFLHASSWRKVGQVFAKNDYACGVGHCGFVTAPDGTDWILYHAKTRQRPGWNDREVRAQPFHWTTSGYPMFGQPGPKRLLDAALLKSA
jgi:GH43 family beta-xylosidase